MQSEHTTVRKSPAMKRKASRNCIQMLNANLMTPLIPNDFSKRKTVSSDEGLCVYYFTEL